jgi:hypothetical protein
LAPPRDRDFDRFPIVAFSIDDLDAAVSDILKEGHLHQF